MSETMSALLGCVQSEVSQLDPSGKPKVHQHRLTERIALAAPADGAHVVAVRCKYCQQTVRVQVRSRRTIQEKRLISRVALAASVCLWVAAAAFLLLYFLDQYPAMPGREVGLATLLIGLGVGLWAVVDGRDAFAGDVAVGCRIERTSEEKAWTKQVSRDVIQAMPKHVLLDPDEELVSADLRGEIARAFAAVRRKPAASSTAANSAAAETAASPPASRTA